MTFKKVLACLLAAHFCAVATPAAADVWNWSQTASSNSNADIDDGIDWAEGQAPSTVNDSARATLAEIAKWRDDISGVKPSNALITTGGTSTAATVSTNGSVSSSYKNGYTVCARMGATSGAAMTLNVDSIGAKEVEGILGTNLVGGELPINTVACFTYRQPTDSFQIVGFVPVATSLERDTTTGAIKRSALTGDVTASAGSNATSIATGAVDSDDIEDGSIDNDDMKNGELTAAKFAAGEYVLPVGMVFDFAGSTCPARSVAAYGQELSDSTYSALLTITGTTYGAGGASTFLAPDTRGRASIGDDDMGGSSANRITTTLNGDTLGATGGEELHTMTSGELVAHTHGDGSFASAAPTITDTRTYQFTQRSTTASTGDGDGENEAARSTNVTATISMGSPTTGTITASTSDVSGATGSTGSTTPFNVMQPSIVFTKCIYAGV